LTFAILLAVKEHGRDRPAPSHVGRRLSAVAKKTFVDFSEDCRSGAGNRCSAPLRKTSRNRRQKDRLRNRVGNDAGRAAPCRIRRGLLALAPGDGGAEDKDRVGKVC